MSDPVVDIVLPTYNRREFLPHAIECIRAQTFRDWQLLVVNDGGEDVADIVAGFADERIVYFSRPHAGKPTQLNFALANSSAPYIAYMDDDDEVFPTHLETLLRPVREVGADFVYSDTYLTLLDENGEIKTREPENVRDAPYEEIRVFNRVNHKQILHSRTLAEKVGAYDESMRVLIDYDYIKRLAESAAHPFHVREITGEHFLRKDPKTGAWSSISGIWKRDPAAAGESLLTFFRKDPAALTRLYLNAYAAESKIERMERKLDRRLSARLRRLFRGHRGDGPVFRETLPVPVTGWREIQIGSLLDFFGLADETERTIAAVNRIASGAPQRGDRKLMCSRRSAVLPPENLRFRMSKDGDGLRFVHPAGTPYRWVALLPKRDLPDDFALQFRYTPHTVFREQLQFDFQMSSLGDRLRFMVRDNRRLCFSSVSRGAFRPDDFSIPFSFELDTTYDIRISSCRGVYAFAVNGKTLLAVEAEDAGRRTPHGAALLFYDSAPDKVIDLSLADVRLFVPGK